MMDKKQFANRRKELMRMIGEDGIAVIPASPERRRNRDVYYNYRQDSDFQYLSGFPEPDAVIVLVPKRKHGEYVLFCREKDSHKETWHGRRVGQEMACDEYGADDSFPISDIDDILPGLIEGREKLFCTMGIDSAFDAKVMGWINNIRENARGGAKPPQEIVSLENILHEMRLFKNQAEIKHMRKAAQITVEAHNNVMSICKPNMMEYELEAEFLGFFKKNGCDTAYPSIVGAASNGCILHYIENCSKLMDGDLVLIDAGAEYDGYAADITRTFPVNGRFSSEQKALYDIVLNAQKAAIAEILPGKHWNDSHDAAVREIVQGLIDVKILFGCVDDLIEQKAYQQFFMHRTGHWLGMDVHDVGDYKIGGEWRVLEAGMVTTVEPGLYISPSKGVDEKWWDIGIRIEDDILITKKGNENLTEGAIKEVNDIEIAMSGLR